MLGIKKGEDRSARKAYLGRASLKKALSKKEEEWRPFKSRERRRTELCNGSEFEMEVRSQRKKSKKEVQAQEATLISYAISLSQK